MFSGRSHFKQMPNPLFMLLMSRQNEGKEVIDLTDSNPTQCRFTYPSSWIKALSKNANLIYEPNPNGNLNARIRVVKYYRELGADVKPGQVFFASGTSEAYHFLFSLLMNPGDHLLVPAPGYPLMESLGILNDIAIDSYHQEFDGMRWKIDFDSLQTLIGPRTGAIMLVHPNNPTGSYIDRKDQVRLVSLAKKNRLPIIADEVFYDYLYPDMQILPRSFSTRNQTLVFTLNGLSKMACLPQLKLSWILITGPQSLVREAARRLEMIADAYLSVNTPVQNAIGLYLDGRFKIQSQVLHRILKNRAYLAKALKERLPEGDILNSEGGWYVTIRLPSVMSDEQWAILLLKKEGVLVYPGHFFDFPTESCLVLSLLPPEPLFREGIEKIISRVSYSLSIIG